MAVLLEDGHEVARCKKPTPRTGGPADVIDTVVAAVQKVDPEASAEGVGIGVPGPVVPGTGVLPAAPNRPPGPSASASSSP